MLLAMCKKSFMAEKDHAERRECATNPCLKGYRLIMQRRQKRSGRYPVDVLST